MNNNKLKYRKIAISNDGYGTLAEPNFSKNSNNFFVGNPVAVFIIFAPNFIETSDHSAQTPPSAIKRREFVGFQPVEC